MRIFIRGEGRSELTLALDERTGDVLAVRRFRVRVFDP
jgi:hypothetical protein